MYSFINDYSEGAHPRILDALGKSNHEQEFGYGLDSHTKNAINIINALVEDDSVDIHLLSGGTQTNLIAISSFLRPHEAVIAADTAHIAVHETGAIEYTGHKIITIPSEDGKVTPQEINQVLIKHHDEHLVKPRLVFISNSTEIGTIYTKDELRSLYIYCQENDLLLYLDGARLGVALVADESGLTLADICSYTDAFYIGGTKNGALLGEALVIRNQNLKIDFRYLIKQKGALLAKGRILGIQFEELFKDGLYFELAARANKMAMLLANGLKDKGYKMIADSKTNQLFPIVHNDKVAELEKDFRFYIFEAIDKEHSLIRLVTSWATDEKAVNEFINVL